MQLILLGAVAAGALQLPLLSRAPTARSRGILLTATADAPTYTTAAALKALAAAAKDDIRGVTSASAEVPLQPDGAYWIGAAFRKWLGSNDDIAVGRDPRATSFDISTAFCRGGGACDAGPSTTPAMLESLLGPSAPFAGAAMVTASHLPAEYNGLKLFSRALGRGLNKREVAEVMSLAVEMGAGGTSPDEAAAVRKLDGFMTPYLEKLRAAVREAARDDGARPLEGMRICVNPGNGAGGVFATDVLAPLGADVSASVNLEPDGSFPAHMPNPEDKAHVAATVGAVADSGADLGVMLDTDVDRCGLIDGCVSPPGEVNRNRLIALCAREALEAAGGGGVIVTDPVTSTGMGAFIESLGGSHDRFKMGYRNVIDRAAETEPEPALLAIETSGHSAWRDNAFVDDGCYTAARLIGRLARERRAADAAGGLLGMLGDSLAEPVESIKVKMGVAGGLGDVPKAEEALCAALRRAADGTDGWSMEAVNHDGLRCAVGDDGWLIIRGSLHEPSVSVQTESDVVGGTAQICAALLDFVADEAGECEAAGIDIQPMRDVAAKASPASALAEMGAPPAGFEWAPGVF